jgi:ABC-type amino acid transport substrate-binding protein
MDLGASTDKQMLNKLLAKRCDYALEELEYVVGARMTESDWPDESRLRTYQPRWARGPQLFYLIGRSHPDGSSRQQQINFAIAKLQTQGDIKKLQAQYLQTRIVSPSVKPADR